MKYSDLSVSDKIAFLNLIAQIVAIRKPMDFQEMPDVEETFLGVRDLAEHYAKYIDPSIR
jgi:hypothetical protein